jgi:hypothetical protein
MLNIILYGLLIWFLYNLIFRFIIPVYWTTRQVKQKFREMRQTMQEQMNRQEGSVKPPEPQKSNSPKPGSDYIEFEEVK